MGERLARLQATPVEDLLALPPVSSEDVLEQGKKYVLSVWHDVFPSGTHYIVVQLYRPWFLGLGFMRATGFQITPAKERRPLTDEELWPYR